MLKGEGYFLSIRTNWHAVSRIIDLMMIKIQTNARNAYPQAANMHEKLIAKLIVRKLALKVTLLHGGQSDLKDIMFKHALRMITRNDSGLLLMVCLAASHSGKQTQHQG